MSRRLGKIHHLQDGAVDDEVAATKYFSPIIN